MSAIFVEREIECATAAGMVKGLIQIFRPEPDAQDWRCDYALRWAGFEKKFYALGVDAFQALQLAMSIVPVQIETSDDFKAGRLRFLEKPLTSGNLKESFEVKWYGDAS